MNIYTKPDFEIIEIPADADIITASILGEKLPDLEDDDWN